MVSVNPKTPVVAAAALLLLLCSGCTGGEEYAFEWESGGATYKSNVSEPRGLLRAFSIREKIIVMPEIHLGENSQNQEIFNWSAIPLYTVVAGNDKNAIQMILFMENNGMQECHTNMGDLKTQLVLDRGECRRLLDDWNREAVIHLPLPNPKQGQPFIELGANRITVMARSPQEQAALTGALAEELFPNAKAVLERAGEKLEEMK